TLPAGWKNMACSKKRWIVKKPSRMNSYLQIERLKGKIEDKRSGKQLFFAPFYRNGVDAHADVYQEFLETGIIFCRFLYGLGGKSSFFPHSGLALARPYTNFSGRDNWFFGLFVPYHPDCEFSPFRVVDRFTLRCDHSDCTPSCSRF